MAGWSTVIASMCRITCHFDYDYYKITMTHQQSDTQVEQNPSNSFPDNTIGPQFERTSGSLFATVLFAAGQRSPAMPLMECFAHCQYQTGPGNTSLTILSLDYHLPSNSMPFVWW